MHGSVELMQWNMPADSFRQRCELVIPAGCAIGDSIGRPITVRTLRVLVNAQITVRKRVASRVQRARAAQKLERAVQDNADVQHLKAMIVAACLAGVEEDTLADAHLKLAVMEEVKARKVKAATHAQRLARGWLCRHMVECPICLDESELPPVRTLEPWSRCSCVGSISLTLAVY